LAGQEAGQVKKKQSKAEQSEAKQNKTTQSRTSKAVQIETKPTKNVKTTRNNTNTNQKQHARNRATQDHRTPSCAEAKANLLCCVMQLHALCHRETDESKSNNAKRSEAGHGKEDIEVRNEARLKIEQNKTKQGETSKTKQRSTISKLPREPKVQRSNLGNSKSHDFSGN
jgi:hypothetical protein